MNMILQRWSRAVLLPVRLIIRGRRGQAMVEAALMMPVMLLLLLGVIEAGNGLSIKHKMAVLSREGANIAARGTSLSETMNVVMAGGSEIELSTKGGAVVTRIIVVDGDPVIDAQVGYNGYEAYSRLGMPDSISAPLQGLNLVEGQVFHAVEIIFDYEAMTPLAGIFPAGLTDKVYERAFF